MLCGLLKVMVLPGYALQFDVSESERRSVLETRISFIAKGIIIKDEVELWGSSNRCCFFDRSSKVPSQYF